MANSSVDAFMQQLNTLVATTEVCQLSDAELLEQFVDRPDDSSFPILLQRYGPMVYRVCRRLLNRVQDAEDAFQATFLVLADKARSIRQPEALACWLHGVASRIATHTRNRANRHQVQSFEEIAIPIVDESQDEIERGDLYHVVEEELYRLPENCRVPLILCYLQEQTQGVAARELGWSKSTLRRRVAQGLELLRERLQQRGVTLSVAMLTPLFAPATWAAGVSPELVSSTEKTARLIAMGSMESVSVQVASLMREGAKGLSLSKLKIAVGIVLAVTLFATGAGLLSMQTEPTVPSAERAQDRDEKEARTEKPESLPEGMLGRFGSGRLRHGRPITSLRFSKDGKHVFSASQDYTARVWDVVSGRELEVFMTGTSKVNDLALIDDGKQIAAATHKKGVILFDRESRSQIQRIGEKEIRTLAVTPDTKTLFLGGPGGVQVWESGKNLERKLTSARAAPTNLIVSPDGKSLVYFRTSSPFIQVIDWKNDKALWEERLPGVTIALAFSRTGWLFGANRNEGSSELWRVNPSDPTPIRKTLDLRPLTQDQKITNLVVSSNGRTIYTVGTSLELRAFDLERKKLLFRAKVGNGKETIRLLALSPDGKTLATAGGKREHAIQLWDAETGKERTLGLARNRSELFGLSVSPDGKVVAAGNATHRLTIWDGVTGRTLHEIDRPDADQQHGVAVSPDGRSVAASGINGVALWDVRTGKLLGKMKAPEQIYPVRFFQDGKRLVGGGGNGNLHIWDVKSRNLLRIIKAHQEQIWSLDVSPDGSMVASASFDQTAAVFRLDTGREIARRKDHKWFVRTIAFSPDGLRVATGGEGELTIFVWEVATGELVQKLTSEWVTTSLAWCADGRVLVSGHFYDRLHLWDIATGKWLAMSRARPGPFHWRISASDDGRRVYTAGSDSVVRIWDVAQLVGKLPPLENDDVPIATLETAWAALGKRNASDAHRGVWQLAAAGDRAVRLLTTKLRPTPEPNINEKAIHKLIRDLDDDVFAVREAASAELSKSDPVVVLLLEKALRDTSSAEVRARLVKILRRVRPTETGMSLTPRELQAARAVQALIYIDTPASTRLLEVLAKGKPSRFLTRQAQAAVKRRSRRES